MSPSAPPLPAAAAAHWAAAADGVLKLPYGAMSGRYWYPPTRQDPFTLSQDVEWRAVDGRGRIAGWCVFHRAYFAHLTPPYSVILVKLDAGPSLYSNLSDPDATPLVGAVVEPVFTLVAPGQALVRFRMVDDLA